MKLIENRFGWRKVIGICSRVGALKVTRNSASVAAVAFPASLSDSHWITRVLISVLPPDSYSRYLSVDKFIDLKVRVVSLCPDCVVLLQVGWPMVHPPPVTAAASMVRLIGRVQMVKTQVDCTVHNSAPTEYSSFRWISLISVRLTNHNGPYRHLMI
ncbi:hypothetical protein PoB_007012100 [Plakobranchus ocellatus]|uniref:Uncharacterized protein n=1 Tax=Plakobranchus ocellatus TaxID=259542 RepID=A0AAV4DHJ7_9GAST|nr:hypothetical protein PoB_007012100 [Plakobranchus ocellatus]